ncbi:mitochondrial ribosomal protein S14 [Brevipalpus obovatus]|uniref:mitochondrial ribosomal protein S14 n=1 Tax=Brevipalpus obovatus TaxID=246614 RepID=UPI003D9F9D5A
MIKPFIRAIQPVKSILANVFQSNLMLNRNAQIKYPYLKVKPPPAYTVRPPDPVLDIAFTGSTYDTKVKRRRKIKNLNEPVFGLNPVESLKWTDWRMVRDVRRRYIYCNHFPLKNNLTCLFRNDLLPHTIREYAHSEAAHLFRGSRSTACKWRCTLTSRERGKYLKFRMSRIAFRNLADHNLISGSQKAIW